MTWLYNLYQLIRNVDTDYFLSLCIYLHVTCFENVSAQAFSQKKKGKKLKDIDTWFVRNNIEKKKRKKKHYMRIQFKKARINHTLSHQITISIGYSPTNRIQLSNSMIVKVIIVTHISNHWERKLHAQVSTCYRKYWVNWI